MPRSFWFFALLVACGGAEKPKVVPHEKAEEHLRRIGTVWAQDVRDEGSIEGDPNGISAFSVRTVVRVTLLDGGNANETIEREETFRLASGSKFVCKAKGVVTAKLAYSFQGEEVRVAISNAGAKLPRSCDKPGFPVPNKIVTANTTTFALRSDRLIAIDPPQVHDELLPVQ